MSIQLPNEQDDYYWQLILRDGRKVRIPPRAVETVNRKMTNREPIRTTAETIPFSQIEGFEKTSQRFTDVKLLEETARAFDEPVITADGAVKARWVKKHVTRKEYDNYYSKAISYYFLTETEGMVCVAFVQPVHKIDLNNVEYCTPEEERKLGL